MAALEDDDDDDGDTMVLRFGYTRRFVDLDKTDLCAL